MIDASLAGEFFFIVFGGNSKVSVWREEGGFIGERRFRESRSHAFSGESFFFFLIRLRKQ